jgi:CheY-like chemotaxis protein
MGGERFDLILCDLMMPDMTGIDLHAALVGHDPTLAARMVFLTGGATTPRSRAFVATVADRIVDKPFDPDQLLSMINQRVR